MSVDSMLVDSSDQVRLLDLARAAIIGSLHAERRTQAATAAPMSALNQEGTALLSAAGASFVTLSIAGALRGCIGSIEPSRPLAEDVWHNAQRAAFEDPRFAPLRVDEAADVLLEISVLGPLQRVRVTCEHALLEALRPDVDGLLLSCGGRRATFLPKVWQKLADPQVFVRQLKRKMGVADDFWDDALVISRYETQEFGAMLQTEGTAFAAH